ncbi:hypothetical protein BDD12DRAFT_892444 [Trichophaea hybrida]|nr:hypothetical protein BDD12DRAFT_892444 [Trichophaea hybrida]
MSQPLWSNNKGFVQPQYKKKIKAWKIEKSLPKGKVLQMLKKEDQRLAENKRTYFTFNGEPVNDKLDRSRKRFAHDIANHAASPIASTPSNVEYMTPRTPQSDFDMNSPGPITDSIDTVVTMNEMETHTTSISSPTPLNLPRPTIPSIDSVITMNDIEYNTTPSASLASKFDMNSVSLSSTSISSVMTLDVIGNNTVTTSEHHANSHQLITPPITTTAPVMPVGSVTMSSHSSAENGLRTGWAGLQFFGTNIMPVLPNSRYQSSSDQSGGAGVVQMEVHFPPQDAADDSNGPGVNQSKPEPSQSNPVQSDTPARPVHIERQEPSVPLEPLNLASRHTTDTLYEEVGITSLQETFIKIARNLSLQPQHQESNFKITCLSPPSMVSRNLGKEKNAMDVLLHHTELIIEEITPAGKLHLLKFCYCTYLVSVSELDKARVFIYKLDYNLHACELAGKFIVASPGAFRVRLSSLSDTLWNNPIDGYNLHGAAKNTATFRIGFKLLAHNTDHAGIFLTWAFLHNEDIPYELLRRGLDEDDAAIQPMIDILDPYSLNQRQPSGNTFSIPSAIHSWLREFGVSFLFGNNKNREECILEAFRLICRSVCKTPTEADDWAFERQLHSHYQTCWQFIKTKTLSGSTAEFDYVFVELYMKLMAEFFLRHHIYRDAEMLQSHIVKATKNKLGDKSLSTIDSIQNLAATFARQQRWGEAEVLELSKRVLGHENHTTLARIDSLAATYSGQYRWEDAEKLGMHALERKCARVRKRFLGQEHPKTLQSMSDVASVYRMQRRYSEAEELTLQTLETGKRVLGHEHPFTLNIICKLARIYKRQGRMREAEGLAMLSIEARKRVYGYENPNTLLSVINLAAIYREQRRLSEAEVSGEEYWKP